MSPEHASVPDGTAVPGGPEPTGPEPARPGRSGRHLRPVQRPSRRRSPAVPVLVGTGIVLVALFALAVMHALLISGQLRLDDMQRAVASETEEVHRLRLRVAELESPARVLRVARERLGMVQPAQVGYLVPAGVTTGDSTDGEGDPDGDGRVRVEAAERPEPAQPEEESTADTAGEPDGEADGVSAGEADGPTDDVITESPEQQAVEASVAADSTADGDTTADGDIASGDAE